jgi:hypothetical protein
VIFLEKNGNFKKPTRMNENEKQEIKDEISYYETVLEIHSRNKDKLWKSEIDYQNYVNDILDEIFRLRKRLENKD